MALADFHAGGVGGDQRQADAQFFLFAEQVFRVVGLECQAEQRGYRAEGDVALFPVQAQADDFFTLPLALADDAGVGHGAGVGTGQRTGEGEAGDFTFCFLR